MALGLAKLLIGPVSELLDKFIPDADTKAQLAHDLATMAEKQSHEVILAQIEVNKEQAKHPSMFVAGARPAAMWICNAGLAYSCVIYPVADIWLAMPELNTDLLLYILGGTLGLGGFRMGEKVFGVSRENMQVSK